MNEIQKSNSNSKMTFSAFITSSGMKNKINQIIGDEKSGNRFISSIISAVSTNPSLAECENSSIVSGALLGEALKLSPSPQLGLYYLVPFNLKDRGKVAQFQLGLTI